MVRITSLGDVPCRDTCTRKLYCSDLPFGVFSLYLQQERDIRTYMMSGYDSPPRGWQTHICLKPPTSISSWRETYAHAHGQASNQEGDLLPLWDVLPLNLQQERDIRTCVLPGDPPVVQPSTCPPRQFWSACYEGACPTYLSTSWVRENRTKICCDASADALLSTSWVKEMRTGSWCASGAFYFSTSLVRESRN